MVGRDRRYGRGRQVSLKAKAGIAAAVLVGGGAIGMAAAASSHSSTSASNAGYQWRQHHANQQLNQAQLLALLLASNNQTTVMNNLAQVNTRSFIQARVGNQILAAQRGMVVLAARHFIVVQSANGSLHVWSTSRNTRFTNATTWNQTNALTANVNATNAAMNQNNMFLAANAVGNVNLVNQLVMPAATTRTVSVNIAGTGVTVTVTVTANNTATMNTFTGGQLTNTTTFANVLAAIQNAQARNALARGDLVVVAGVRSHGFLQARTVVFAAATAAGQAMAGGTVGGTVGGTTGGTVNGAPAGMHT